MFNLKVTGYDEALGAVKIGWPTHVISLITRDMPVLEVRHLHLRFDDIIHATPGLIMPSLKHLHDIFDFTEHLDPADRVIVHCQEGIKRSTAAAIGILIQHGVNFEDAYRRITAQRVGAAPNRLLIGLIDYHFGLGGKLRMLRGAP